MLSQPETVHYLMRRGVLNPAQVVRDGVTVTNVSRRHLNYCITTENGAGYLLKQGIGEERAGAVAHEAGMYSKLRATEKFSARYLPTLHLFDEKHVIMVTEWVVNAQNLRDYHRQRGYFALTPSRALANAIGQLHRVASKPDDTTPGGKLPWVLSLHRPTLRFFQECSAANLALIEMIQEFPNFCDHIDALGREWQTETLIHGDLKWDNCIISGKTPQARKSRLRIVDWELAKLGDPCWDIGSLFQEYLGFWLLSIPITGNEPPERFPNLAKFPLEKMHPALRAFWEAYCKIMQFDHVQAEQCLLRSVRFAAARLLQTAFEQMQNATQPNGNVVCMLQLSLNMLERPREAAVHLLGIPSLGFGVNDQS